MATVRKMILRFLVVLALAAPCQAQVQQYIRFNTTLDYSPVPQGSAAGFLSQSSAIAAYEALTRVTFEAGIAAEPDLNPLLTSPPALSSLKVVGAVDGISGGSSLAVTFQTVMRVASAAGLSDDNLPSLQWAPYWYSDATIMHGYMMDLADQVPTTFASLSSYEISVGVAQGLVPVPSPPAPVAPPPVVSPTRAPVRPPSWSPVLPTAMPVVAPTRVPAVAPTPRPVAPPSWSPVPVPTASSPVVSPVAAAFPAPSGIEQFLAVNCTLVLTGVAANSVAIFQSDPAKVETYAVLTQHTFEDGIAASALDTNPLFNAPPEILSLNVVDVQSSATNSISITSETTMRIYADTVLTEQDYFDSVRFGPYWHANSDHIFAYLFELRGLFPEMFLEEGSFQIGLGVATGIDNPTPRAPVATPTQQPVASSVAPVPFLSAVAPVALPTWSPVVNEPAPEGIEQYIIINGTIEFSGVGADSSEIFMRDPASVAAFEGLTLETFAAGIADPNSDQNSILTVDPQVLGVQVVKVANPSVDSLAVTFQTTMRLYSYIVLTDQNFLVNVKFGPYFSADPDRSFAYVLDVASVYPTLFVEQEIYFQIDFGTAKSIPDPIPTLTTPPTSSPTNTATLVEISPTLSPVVPDSEPVQGIEQYVIVNGTIEFSGVVADSSELFVSDPTSVAAFEALTLATFVAGIADPNSNQNSILTTDPQVLDVNVVKVTNPAVDSLAVTFQTTMRLYSYIVLTDYNFLVNVKFGPYFSADPDRSFAYVQDVVSVYPTLFVAEEIYFQIDFGTAKSIPEPPTTAPVDIATSQVPSPTAAPVTVAVDNESSSSRPPTVPNSSTSGSDLTTDKDESQLSSAGAASRKRGASSPLLILSTLAAAATTIMTLVGSAAV